MKFFVVSAMAFFISAHSTHADALKHKSKVHQASRKRMPAAHSIVSESPPAQPTDRAHPGSSYYPFSHQEVSLDVGGRTVTLFLPQATAADGDGAVTGKFPVIAFGHGHTVPMFAYRRTFQHLADKGIAVLNIDYDTGWFDHDFERMARDYSYQVQAALEAYKEQLDAEKVVFSGHSNGGYVALLAAGLPEDERRVDPKAVVVFAASGARSEYLARVNPNTVVTLVAGDEDTGVPAELAPRIYDELTIKKKQYILLHSYLQTNPEVKADHGLCRTSGWGGAFENALHYYGTWKFLVAAAWDLQKGGRADMPFLYGDLASSTGLPDFFHSVKRNWTAAPRRN